MNKLIQIFTSLLCASLLTLTTGFASAAEQAFDRPSFDKLVADGKPVIVDFYADWCPTCKAQAPSVQALANEPRMKDVTIFKADYDKEKELKKLLRVSSQSTFVVFKAGKEVARSTGQTKKEDIDAVFSKAL